jgi:hypothetical protein
MRGIEVGESRSAGSIVLSPDDVIRDRLSG